jgi:hypothetical protein
MSATLKLRAHRLRVMAGVLDWEGEISNARVRELFDLQPVQASRLLAEFRSFMGERLADCGRGQVLLLANPRMPGSQMPLDEYARLATAVESEPSCVIDARIDLTDIAPYSFAVLRKAALSATGVVIGYASMTTPVAENRMIFPHAIVHIGRRWHVRAWCAKRNEFRDFTLGRISSAVGVPDHSPQPAKTDRLWQKTVQIRLVAHRGLSEAQQSVVRLEYFKGTMARRQTVRACLVPYVIQDVRAAIDPEREAPPEFQIEVANVAELSAYLF